MEVRLATSLVITNAYCHGQVSDLLYMSMCLCMVARSLNTTAYKEECCMRRSWSIYTYSQRCDP